MNVVVAGAGAWGTAIAIHLARLGRTVTLVPRRLEHAVELASSRENARLPGVRLPDPLQLGLSWEAVLPEADVLLLACPSAHLEALVAELRPHLARSAAGGPGLVATLCKGLEIGTGRMPAKVVADGLGDAGRGRVLGALSGPSNALEVGQGRPTALVLGFDETTGPSPEEASTRAHAFQHAAAGGPIRVYTSTDLVGVELGGCLKNVYAIAAGVCDGLQVGDNGKAALLTRCLPEMTRLGAALGGRAETFQGLSGFGDLVATCFGAWSRNRAFGQAVARGGDPAALAAASTVEGYRTAGELAAKARAAGVDAPVLEQVAALLAGETSPEGALRALMGRGLRREA